MEIWQLVLTVCGGIGTIGGAAAVIGKSVKPIANIKKDVETLKAHDKEHAERLERDAKEHQAILKALYALLGSGIDGNGKEQLKEARSKLWEQLIEK